MLTKAQLEVCKAAYKNAHDDRDTTLDDTAISEVIENMFDVSEWPDEMSLEDDGAAAVAAALEDAEDNDNEGTEAEQALRSKLTATGMGNRALAAVKKAAESSDFRKATNELLDSIAKTKVAGLTMFQNLLKAGYTKEDFASWPVPGTQNLDANKDFYASNNPDRYQETISGEKIKSGFYKDMAHDLPEGQIQAQNIRVADQALQYFLAKALCPDPYKGKTRQKVMTDRAAFKARLAALEGTLKKAARIQQQIARAAEYPGVIIEVATVDDKPVAVSKTPGYDVFSAKTDIANTPTPFLAVHPTNKRASPVEMTIDKFLSLDFETALAAGGTFDNLIATVARGKTEEEATDVVLTPALLKTVTFNMLTLDNVPAVALALANYVDNKSNYESLMKALSKDDDLLYSLNQMQEAIEAITSKHDKKLEQLTKERGTTNSVKAA